MMSICLVLHIWRADDNHCIKAHFDELREALNMTTARDTGITSLVQPPPVRPPQPEESQVSITANFLPVQAQACRCCSGMWI